VYAWFDAGLGEPYNKLWYDYRFGPDSYKVWNMSVIYGNSSSDNVTVSWNTSDLTDIEYNYVWLKDVDSDVYVDMFSNSNYTYLADGFVVHSFQIICSMNPLVSVFDVALSEEWNLVSLPVNESVSKDNITVYYGGSNHTWSEAVSDVMVLDFVYGWDAVGQGYLQVDVLESGEGYWMYAYDGCTLWVSGSVNSDNYVTDLSSEWNLMGSPFDFAVDKDNLTVDYGGFLYNWSEAVSAGIVLDFVYGWDAVGQGYLQVDVLESGDGFWMYAYDGCILKKKVS
jgi:hypothetical protein